MHSSMSKQRFATLAVACFAIALLHPASLRAEKLLRWKFEKGDQRKMELTQDMTIAMTAQGQTVKMKMIQTMVMQQTVEDVDDQGNATIKQKFAQIKMSMEGAPNASFSYDSASKDPPKGIATFVAPLFEAFMKAPFESKISPQGKILDVTVPDEFVKAAKEQPAAQLPGVSEIFSKEGLTQMMKQSAAAFPEQPVEKGDQWSDTVELKNPVGKQIVTTNYTYEGEEEIDGKRLDKLSVSLKIEFAAGDNAVAQVAITDQSANGSLWFDAETGQLDNGTIDQHLKMEITVMGNKIPQDITTKTDIKVTPEAQ